MTKQTQESSLTLYYDGLCPLCQAEITWLSSRNAKKLLYFVDVSASNYEAASHQISCQAALDQMHGKLSDGTMLVGVEVFAAAYQRADLALLAWLFTRPWLSPILRFCYKVFARYRHRISALIGPLALKLVQYGIKK
jgi:predicted DCC family thiol-disulfide oxidoreductase YuxK